MIRKTILFALTIFIGINTYAKTEKTEKIDDVEIYLKGGDKIPGYLKLKRDYKPAFILSNTTNGEIYLNTIDSVITKTDSAVFIPLKWIELSEIPLYKEYDITLLRRIYKGKNIDGYLGLSEKINVPVHTGSGTYYYNNPTIGDKYYYYVKEEDFAYAYFIKLPGNFITVNPTGSIKRATKKIHPKLSEYVATKEFKEATKGLAKNPEIALPEFDKAFDK